jgi:hypothetical protein
VKKTLSRGNSGEPEETDEKAGKNSIGRRDVKQEISDKNQDVSSASSRKGRKEESQELQASNKTNGTTNEETLYSSWSEGLTLEGTQEQVLTQDASSRGRKNPKRSSDRSLRPRDTGKDTSFLCLFLFLRDRDVLLIPLGI